MTRFLVIGVVAIVLGVASASMVQADGRYGHWRYPDTPGFYPQRTTFGFGLNNFRYGRSYGYGNPGLYRGPAFGRRSYYGAPRGNINIYYNSGRRNFGGYRGW